MGVPSWFPQKSDGFTSRTTGVQHLPVNKCGNLIGKMTASLRASLAPSSPATSFHRMLGFSITTAPAEGGKAFNLEPRPTRGPSTRHSRCRGASSFLPISCSCNFFFSGLSPSLSLSLLGKETEDDKLKQESVGKEGLREQLWLPARW